MVFQTDAAGPHTWEWDVSWGSFDQSGSDSTESNTWDAQAALVNYGGTLTVTASANGDSVTIAVRIVGTNPSVNDVVQYLASQPNSNGFDKILEQESRCCQFNASGQPIESFDNGYGMCQLTTPPPSYELVWNWRLNLQGGLALFATKRQAAITYLGQAGRTYSEDQVRYETVCRWNGGAYYLWDSQAGQWVRNQNILCDSTTGNIGWDMADPENQGQTEAQLHARDVASYRGGRPAGAHWRYFGVCYADKVLG
jgi:hypothetical protein